MCLIKGEKIKQTLRSREKKKMGKPNTKGEQGNVTTFYEPTSYIIDTQREVATIVHWHTVQYKLVIEFIILECFTEFAGVKHFLTECRPKLQIVFNSCKFHRVDCCLEKLHEHTVEMVTSLKAMARSLLGHKQQACSAGYPEGR